MKPAPPLAVSIISKQQHGGCQDECQQRGHDEPPPYNSARKFGPVLGRRRTKDDFACEEVQVRTSRTDEKGAGNGEVNRSGPAKTKRGHDNDHD